MLAKNIEKEIIRVLKTGEQQSKAVSETSYSTQPNRVREANRGEIGDGYRRPHLQTQNGNEQHHGHSTYRGHRYQRHPDHHASYSRYPPRHNDRNEGHYSRNDERRFYRDGDREDDRQYYRRDYNKDNQRHQSQTTFSGRDYLDDRFDESENRYRYSDSGDYYRNDRRRRLSEHSY